MGLLQLHHPMPAHFPPTPRYAIAAAGGMKSAFSPSRLRPGSQLPPTPVELAFRGFGARRACVKAPSLRLSRRSVLYWVQTFSSRNYRVSTPAGILVWLLRRIRLSSRHNGKFLARIPRASASSYSKAAVASNIDQPRFLWVSAPWKNIAIRRSATAMAAAQ